MNATPVVEELYAAAHWFLAQERARDAGAVFRAMVLAAPADERGWLGLGACHERLDQLRMAREMYGLGRALAAPSVRCEIALSRVLRTLGEDDEAAEAVHRAREIADSTGELHELVVGEGP